MKLLRASEVEAGQNDQIFRHARWRALLICLAAVGADAAMFINALTGRWQPGYVFGTGLLLFLLLLGRYVAARFKPSNWLVRANEVGLAAQYRSYLTYRLPTDAATVVFIAYEQIASARLVRECVRVPDPDSGKQTKNLRYVELELSGDTDTLANALRQERLVKPVSRKRWYGSSSTLYLDYPLGMTAPYLRIRWDVVPGASKFLESLRPHTAIAETVSLTRDFTQLRSLSGEQQREQLRDLAIRGEPIAAAYIARELYGGSLAEASETVKKLAEDTHSRDA